MSTFFRFGYLAALCACLAANAPAQSAKEKLEATAQETAERIEEAGKSAASTLETVWERIDERRLKNRTRDELVAWAIVGIMVGSVAGLFRAVRTNGQHLLDIGLGLTGALLAGIIVNVFKWDLGMGPVLILYEDLFFSLAGGLLLVFAARWMVSRRKKKLSK